MSPYTQQRFTQSQDARYLGMRSWPLAWSRTKKWTVRGAPRYGVARALYEIFNKLKDTM